MNVPDTVNSDRIRVLAEEHGALVKVQLRPDHQGAIVEYLDTVNAGKASLALDGYEIEPGRSLKVGTVPEMLREKAEVKSTRIGGPRRKDASTTLQSSMPIRRPNQPGVKRGGRGGLGVKRGGVGHSIVTNGAPEDTDMDAAGGGAKSNSDFKAMFLKG